MRTEILLTELDDLMFEDSLISVIVGTLEEIIRKIN